MDQQQHKLEWHVPDTLYAASIWQQCPLQADKQLPDGTNPTHAGQALLYLSNAGSWCNHPNCNHSEKQSALTLLYIYTHKYTYYTSIGMYLLKSHRRYRISAGPIWFWECYSSGLISVRSPVCCPWRGRLNLYMSDQKGTFLKREKKSR